MADNSQSTSQSRDQGDTMLDTDDPRYQQGAIDGAFLQQVTGGNFSSMQATETWQVIQQAYDLADIAFKTSRRNAELVAWTQMRQALTNDVTQQVLTAIKANPSLIR